MGYDMSDNMPENEGQRRGWLLTREFDTSKRKKHLSALVNIAVSLSNFSF